VFEYIGRKMVGGISRSFSSQILEDEELEVPLIDNDEPLPDVARKLSR
jgi:hypothetical protein